MTVSLTENLDDYSVFKITSETTAKKEDGIYSEFINYFSYTSV